MNYDNVMKELEMKVLKIMDELQDISIEYCSWDEWDKSKCLDKAIFVLFEKYEDAKVEQCLETTNQEK